MTTARKVEIVAVVLAVVCLGCLLLTIGFDFGFYAGRLGARWWSGGLSVTYRPVGQVVPAGVFFDPTSSSFFSRNGEPQWTWMPTFVSRRSSWFLDVPLWIPFVLTSTVAAIAHRKASQPKPGTCPKCGYDLTGNVTGVCPECGTAESTGPSRKPTSPGWGGSL